MHGCNRGVDGVGRLRKVRFGIDAGCIFQPPVLGQAVTVGDEAEPEIVTERRRRNARDDVFDGGAGRDDIGLHAERGVEHKDDAGLEILQLGRGRRGRRRLVGRCRQNFQHTHRRPDLAFDLLRAQDRQKIEIACDVDIVGRLHRHHGARMAGERRRPQRIGRVARIGVQDDTFLIIRRAQEQHALAPGRVGEGADHGVLPVDRLVGRHPTVNLPAGGPADLNPAMIAALAGVDVEDRETRYGLRPGSGGLR
jgi:hypothetical protein